MDKEIRNAVATALRRLEVEIPVYSGALKGAFQPLAREVRVPWTIRPLPMRSKDNPGGAHPSGWMPWKDEFGPAAGQAAMSFSFWGNDQGAGFSLEIKLQHFIDNEWNEMRSQGIHLKWETPWHLLNDMRSYMYDYLLSVLPSRYPRIKDFIIPRGEVTYP